MNSHYPKINGIQWDRFNVNQWETLPRSQPGQQGFLVVLMSGGWPGGGGGSSNSQTRHLSQKIVGWSILRGGLPSEMNLMKVSSPTFCIFEFIQQRRPNDYFFFVSLARKIGWKRRDRVTGRVVETVAKLFEDRVQPRGSENYVLKVLEVLQSSPINCVLWFTRCYYATPVARKPKKLLLSYLCRFSHFSFFSFSSPYHTTWILLPCSGKKLFSTFANSMALSPFQSSEDQIEAIVTGMMVRRKWKKAKKRRRKNMLTILQQLRCRVDIKADSRCSQLLRRQQGSHANLLPL